MGLSMVTTCVHCGYFIRYALPKAPALPGWVHTAEAPERPAGPPCDNPEAAFPATKQPSAAEHGVAGTPTTPRTETTTQGD